MFFLVVRKVTQEFHEIVCYFIISMRVTLTANDKKHHAGDQVNEFDAGY